MLDELLRTPVSSGQKECVELHQHSHEMLAVRIVGNLPYPLIPLFMESSGLQLRNVRRHIGKDNTPVARNIDHDGFIFRDRHHFLTLALTSVFT
ncbi:hypothetical protein WS50_00450 [Burkholderia territorii]|nr:hypothetical protein WS47_13890 [Burkholderia territorii]KUZ18525.1 hypothetical protein WS50_00450 [Burkholderia territorii]